MSKRTTPPLPRALALGLIAEVQAGAMLTEAVEALKTQDPQQRATAQRLAAQTLRWMDRADRILGPYVKRKPAEPVLNVLRLGTVEMLAAGGAPHGVVHELVGHVRRAHPQMKASGMVNAVLRRVAGDAEKWQALPAPRLPKWLRAPLIKAYDKHIIADIEVAHARGAPLDLTLKAAGSTCPDEHVLLPSGSLRLHNPGQVSALPGYEDGAWWVQDAAAALPVQALAPKAGEKVLDLCAAPGGKTMQLAAAGADVTALDVSKRRMRRVEENLARTGLSARLVVADVFDYKGESFDAVLLDAPCSATGTIRRHPDLPIAKAEADLSELVPLQARMLDHAATLLRPGGRLVFCTCSLLPEEGEAQIAPALSRIPGLALDLDALRLPGIDPAWIGETGLRLRPDYWPELGGMDGFFITALRKPG